MPEYAEFRTSRPLNILIGTMMLPITVLTFNKVFFGNEADFLNGGWGRRARLFHGIEQAVGWDGFRILLVFAGIILALLSITAIWKGISRIPDAKAFRNHIEFHPGIKETPIRYEEVVSWSVGPFMRQSIFWRNGQILSIRLKRPYWSFQTAFWQKRMRLVGSSERLDPIIEFLSQHPVMGPKRID